MRHSKSMWPAFVQLPNFLPVLFEEPDVTCTLDGRKYALAAKRIKNIDNLQERIRKAGEQIDRSGLDGIIALDLGPAFNPDNRRFGPMHDTVFFSEYQSNINATWSKHQSKIQKIIARHRVLGIIVHDYHVRRQDHDWQLAGLTNRILAESRSTKEQRLFNRLSTLYTYGLPNQNDESTRSLILP